MHKCSQAGSQSVFYIRGLLRKSCLLFGEIGPQLERWVVVVQQSLPTRGHSSTLAECLWRPKSGCEHSEVVVCCSSSESDSGAPLLVHIVMCMACRLFFITGEVARLMVVNVL